MTRYAEIQGTCRPKFGAVREAFATNFVERDELGAAVAVYEDGELVVDLWGGFRDADATEPWERDTIVCMMSVGKALAALCVHLLIDRGRIDPRGFVANYWPEYGTHGKSETTVSMLLAHQAGVVFTDHAPAGLLLDQEAMAKALAASPPAWPPGSRHAYHTSTYGILVSELVRRVADTTIDDFFRAEIAEPLVVDYRFGVPEQDRSRCATIILNSDNTTLRTVATEPDSKLARAWRAQPRVRDFFNSNEFRSAVFPSGNGHGNARAVAKIFGVLGRGGEIGGRRLVKPETIAYATAEQWNGDCWLLGRHFRMARGFYLNSSRVPMGPNPRSFGHMGAGGTLAFADPERRIGFAYCKNRMSAGDSVGKRCSALVEATFARESA